MKMIRAALQLTVSARRLTVTTATLTLPRTSMLATPGGGGTPAPLWARTMRSSHTKPCLTFQPTEAPAVPCKWQNTGDPQMVRNDRGNHNTLELEEKVLGILMTVFPSDHPDIAAMRATSMSNLSALYSALGRHQEALEMRLDSLALRKGVVPADHPDAATSMGKILMSKYPTLDLNALDYYESFHVGVLAFPIRVLPSNHLDLAMSMDNLASLYLALEWNEEANYYFRHALEFRKRELPSDHLDLAMSMDNLASTYMNMDPGWAVDFFKAALEFRKRELPSDHPDIATSMVNLALACLAVGELEDALHYFEAALTFRKRELPSGHPDIATLMDNLALTCLALEWYGDEELEEECLDDLSAFHKRVSPSDHAAIANSMHNLGAKYLHLGHLGAAELAMKGAVHILVRAGYDPSHHEVEKMLVMYNTPHTLGRSGGIMQRRACSNTTSSKKKEDTGRKEKEKKMRGDERDLFQLTENISLRDYGQGRTLGDDVGNHEERRKIYGRHSDEERMLHNLLDLLMMQAFSSDHPDIAAMRANVMETLSIQYSTLGRRREALVVQENALALRLRKGVLPPDSPDEPTSMGEDLTYEDPTSLWEDFPGSMGGIPIYEDPTSLWEDSSLWEDYPGSGSMGGIPMYEDPRSMGGEDPISIDGILTCEHPTLDPDELDLEKPLQVGVLAFPIRVLPWDRLWKPMYSNTWTWMEDCEEELTDLPSDDLDIATSLDMIAATYFSSSYFCEAAYYFEDALAFRRRELPPDHPDIAKSMRNVAAAYLALHSVWYDDAMHYVEAALAFRKRELPSDHPDIATSMDNLALTFLALEWSMEWYADELPWGFEDLSAFQKRVSPSDHVAIANSMHNLGAKYLHLGNVGAAELAMKGAVNFLVRAGYDQSHHEVEKMLAKYMGDLASVRRKKRASD